MRVGEGLEVPALALGADRVAGLRVAERFEVDPVSGQEADTGVVDGLHDVVLPDEMDTAIVESFGATSDGDERVVPNASATVVPARDRHDGQERSYKSTDAAYAVAIIHRIQAHQAGATLRRAETVRKYVPDLGQTEEHGMADMRYTSTER